MKRIVLVNPAAGGGACGRLAPKYLDRLRRSGLELEVRTTRGPGDATRLTQEARRAGHRSFIAVGGDGTSHEVVNGLFTPGALVDRQDPPELGILPLGTGNSFLRDFHDRGAEGAVDALMDGKPRRCDVARLTHSKGVLHFINNFLIGFAADVSALRNRKYSSIGQLGYVLAVIGQVKRLAPAPIPFATDGGSLDRAPLTFLTVANSRFTGGKMMMAPEADTADGLLDIIRAGAMSRPSLLLAFPKIFKGTHLGHKAVSSSRSRVVELDLDGPRDVLIDGELLELEPERIEVLEGALEVLV